MQLETFQVLNYRSIMDSGEIAVSRITTLLGRNESGKSNLLRALSSLNPSEGFGELSPIKDFPRDRSLSQCDDATIVLTSTWSLSDQEWDELCRIWPRAKRGEPISIGRYFGDRRWVGITGEPVAFDTTELSSKVKKVAFASKAVASSLEYEHLRALDAAADRFAEVAAPGNSPEQWAAVAGPAAESMRVALAKADAELSPRQDAILTELAELADSISGDEEAHKRARSWVMDRLPVFVYLDEYPEIEGKQDIAAFIKRKEKGEDTTADRNFEKLCKVADLDLKRLNSLAGDDTAERNQLVNRASAVISAKLQKLWTDRKLKIRFNLDGKHLETFVSDSSKDFDVEVNLDERSRGFRWFFAFHMTFASDTEGSEKDDAILLLDEPGLFLHGKTQGDLLRHLENDFRNQVLYTTHSPYMVPTDHLDWVRTVNISDDGGTAVSNEPIGDWRTLFPLQVALGIDLSRGLLPGGEHLVVSDLTDFWVLSAASDYLRETGRGGLNRRVTITPAGGARKLPYMVSLLSAETQDVVVLLEHEAAAAATRERLAGQRLLRDQGVLSIGEAFELDMMPDQASIEDLLDGEVYESLALSSHADELGRTPLEINDDIQEHAQRMASAFETAGIEFHRARVARLLIKRMGTDPAAIITDAAADRFARLFRAVNDRFEQQAESAATDTKRTLVLQ